MLKLSSNEFYSRHEREIYKYIKKNEKTLYITANKRISNVTVDGKVDTLVLDLEKDIVSQLSDLNSYHLVVVTDIFELIDDIYTFLQKISFLIMNDGMLIISTINNIWSPILKVFEVARLKNNSTPRSYMPIKKLNTISRSAGFEKVNAYTQQYIPFKIFGVGHLLNSIFESVFSSLNFGIRTYLLFNKGSEKQHTHLSKSIIIPAKNEEGNLEPLINRIPDLGKNTEIIISCGKSEDKTVEIANSIKKRNFQVNVIIQTKNGKANAVWEALEVCKGDVVAILDADISVEPEKLKDFFEIIEYGRADFVNGTRLIYSMEKGAMRFLNVLGNRIFQRLISVIIKQPLTDSLCGTKVFKIEQKTNILDWQNSLKADDPFGDFDLLFSAAYSGKQILELPVHYKKRVYGKTQISRFRDGFKLIKYLFLSYIILNKSK